MIAQWTQRDRALTAQVFGLLLKDVGEAGERHVELGEIAMHWRRPCTANEHEPLYPVIVAQKQNGSVEQEAE